MKIAMGFFNKKEEKEQEKKEMFSQWNLTEEDEINIQKEILTGEVDASSRDTKFSEKGSIHTYDMLDYLFPYLTGKDKLKIIYFIDWELNRKKK